MRAVYFWRKLHVGRTSATMLPAVMRSLEWCSRTFTSSQLTTKNSEFKLFYSVSKTFTDNLHSCRFALNRGLHGNSPCTVCHIRSGELANIRGRFQYRVNADAQDIVNKIESAVEREEALQEIGMRDIKVSLRSLYGYILITYHGSRMLFGRSPSPTFMRRSHLIASMPISSACGRITYLNS